MTMRHEDKRRCSAQLCHNSTLRKQGIPTAESSVSGIVVAKRIWSASSRLDRKFPTTSGMIVEKMTAVVSSPYDSTHSFHPLDASTPLLLLLLTVGDFSNYCSTCMLWNEMDTLRRRTESKISLC